MSKLIEIKDLKTNFYTYEGIVQALDGINLVVERRDNGSHPSEPSSLETEQAGAKANKRHCH